MNCVSRHGHGRAIRAPGAARKRRNTGAGFTLIELAIAVSILMIGMVSVLSATSRMHSLRKQNRERSLAQNAARSVAERIHARSYELSESPDTWAEDLISTFSAGGAHGPTFDVRALPSLPDREADGLISFVTDETMTDGNLGFRIGMPRDLNGDGDDDDTDVSGDARIIPVLLEVRWRSQSGESSYTHAFYIMGY